MKKIVLIALMLMPVLMFATDIKVIKSQGKLHKDGTVTYNRIEQRFDSRGRLVYQSCTGRGREACPPVPIIVVGTIGGVIDNAIVEVENIMVINLKKGITEGKVEYYDLTFRYRNAKITKDDTGKEELEYQLTIDFKNIGDVDGIINNKKIMESED